jgi:hypothetical protein
LNRSNVVSFPPGLSNDQDGHALVGVVVEIPVPQLVLDGETHIARFECGLATDLRHDEISGIRSRKSIPGNLLQAPERSKSFPGRARQGWGAHRFRQGKKQELG